MTVTYSSVARSLHPLMKLSWVQVHVIPWKFSRLLFWFNLTWSYGDKFFIYFHQAFSTSPKSIANQRRGIEWFPEKQVSQKIFAPSQNLRNSCDTSRSLVFRWFCVSVSQIFWKLGLEFSNRVAVSQSLKFTILYSSERLNYSWMI